MNATREQDLFDEIERLSDAVQDLTATNATLVALLLGLGRSVSAVSAAQKEVMDALHALKTPTYLPFTLAQRVDQ